MNLHKLLSQRARDSLARVGWPAKQFAAPSLDSDAAHFRREMEAEFAGEM